MTHTALSAPPSQSESDELTKAQAECRRLRSALDLSTPTLRQGYQQHALLCRIAEYDWLDDPSELRRALDRFVEEARELTQRTKARAAKHDPSPSHTPYVRPAADIKAEIERLSAVPHILDTVNFCGYRVGHIPRQHIIAALTWALTPPTKEPRR